MQAIKDANIPVEALEETIIDDGHIACDYTHKIENTGDQQIWIVYYKHFYYGESKPPNDYEFCWHKVSPLQTGESWKLSSSISNCVECTPPICEAIYYSIAVVYDHLN